MGILALQFKTGESTQTLELTGEETITIMFDDHIKPHQEIKVMAKRIKGETINFTVICRIDTINEVDYFKAGGILHYVLRQMIAKK